MAQDKTIVQLGEKSIDISSPGDILIPTSINGTNWYINLGSIITALKTLISNTVMTDEQVGNAIATYLQTHGINGGGSSGGEGGETPSGDTTQLELDVNNLKSRVATLESVSTWPQTVITLKNGNRSVDYTIPTNPGGRGYDKGAIIIETSSATVPNFYVTINIGTPEVLGTTAYINATVTVTNQHDGLNLLGGTVGTVALSGSLVMSDGSVHTLSGSKSSSTTLVSGETSSDTETVYFTSLDRLTATVTSGTSVSKVTLSCTISGVSVSGSAERVGTTAIDGSGYIILPQS